MKNNDGFRIKHLPYYQGVRIELYGNTRAVIEGCTGILSYQNNIVKIRTSKMAICFKGRNLRIRCLDKESLVVEGFILSAEYII